VLIVSYQNLLWHENKQQLFQSPLEWSCYQFHSYYHQHFNLLWLNDVLLFGKKIIFFFSVVYWMHTGFPFSFSFSFTLNENESFAIFHCKSRLKESSLAAQTFSVYIREKKNRIRKKDFYFVKAFKRFIKVNIRTMTLLNISSSIFLCPSLSLDLPF